MFYFRVSLAAIWLALSSFLGTLLALFKWGDLSLGRDFGRIFSWGALRIFGIRIEVSGHHYLESDQPCIYVANHQSGLDAAVFGLIYPKDTVIIGKKEVVWIPFFGLFFLASGNILIDRSKRVSAVARLDQAVDAIRQKKVSIWIFPEGTRNRSWEGLLPFKKGAFRMAIQAGIPIVPIVCESLSTVVDWKKKHCKGGNLRVQVLPPISTQGLQQEDADQLLEKVHGKMLEAIHGLVS